MTSCDEFGEGSVGTEGKRKGLDRAEQQKKGGGGGAMRKVLVTALQLALLASAASGWSSANLCERRLLLSVDGAQEEKKAVQLSA